MKTETVNRRSLLRSAAVPLLASVPGMASEGRMVRSLLAEGVVGADTVVGQQPLQLPPAIVSALQSGSQLRIRVVYPDRRGLASFYGFLAAPSDPPPPLPVLAEDDPRLFTLLKLEIEEQAVALYPEPTLLLTGRMAQEALPSPFFPGLTGRLCGITAGFENEGQTTFSMLGVFASGSHASYARVAYDSVQLKGSCDR